MKAIISITQWPAGIGLELEDSKGLRGTCFAGPHGGGVGTTLHRIPVDLDRLKDVIAEYEQEEFEAVQKERDEEYNG